MSQAGIATGGGGGGTNIQTITGDTGGPVSPDAAHNINLDALYTNSVVGTPLTNTLTITPTVRGYPISPYVVGPATFAGYQTIQSAIDAAFAAGGGTVYIQHGTYTENLTLRNGVALCGVEGNVDTLNVKIVGTHTPDSTNGVCTFRALNFYGTTSIISSAAAGQGYLSFETCNWILSGSGYIFDMLNWVGPTGLDTGNAGVAITNSGDLSTGASGFLRNTAGMQANLINSYVGSYTSGLANTLTMTGKLELALCDVYCPVDMGGAVGNFIEYTTFHGFGITASGNSTGDIVNSAVLDATTAAFTMSSSGAWEITNCTLDSSNNPVVDGAGAGVLTYAGLVFLNNTNFAGTLTLQPANWRPYATAGTALNAVRGTAGFDSTRFTVTNGFVTLNGAGFTWVDQAVSTTLLVNTGYYVTAASTQTLPAAPQQGDTVKIICDTASAVVVTANAGQSIRLSASASSVAGTFTNTARGDSLDLFYRAATTQWIALNAVGNWTVA